MHTLKILSMLPFLLINISISIQCALCHQNTFQVMKIVDEVVHVIDHPNKIWDILLNLGKIHFGEKEFHNHRTEIADFAFHYKLSSKS